MRLSDLGEEALIEHLVRKFALPASGEGLVLGEGDDAAVLDAGGPTFMLVTTDMLGEGVHFRADIITPYQLGWKSVAGSISDIAAMGGRPTWTLVSIGLKAETDLDYVDELYEGMVACARRFGSEIIGGDTISVSNGSVISVTQLGEIEKDYLLRRSGAKPGDRIVVTGWLGNSVGGLRLLMKYGMEEAARVSGCLVRAHLMPVPRLAEAQAAAHSRGVHAMMDLSDGLGADLPKLCTSSGVGALVFAEKVLISKDLYAAAEALEMDPLQMAISGGEDYELLMAIPESNLERVAAEVQSSTGTPVTVIGEVTEDSSVLIQYPDGIRKPLDGGWEHFSSP